MHAGAERSHHEAGFVLGRVMDRPGKCMCGAVTFIAKQTAEGVSACHCGMCRRWSGGVWMGVGVKEITWESEEALRTIQSSDWAERGFCSECGTSLFYRLTAEGKYQGVTSVSLGCLDDPSGLEIQREWFIDKKPDAYALAGDHQTVTEAEAFAMFSAGASS